MGRSKEGERLIISIKRLFPYTLADGRDNNNNKRRGEEVGRWTDTTAVSQRG